jgi:hypothetical protein
VSLEADLGDANEMFFFREFTYSSAKFKPQKKNEYELADSVVWLDDFLIVAQLKERFPSFGATAEDEDSWFRSEVLEKAAKQITDTIRYLNSYDSITLVNRQGHKFNLANAKNKKAHKLVIYRSPNPLSALSRSHKFVDISTVGIAHVIEAHDYLDIMHTLITLSEVQDYLEFREVVIKRWPDLVSGVPEQALMGQFIRNLPDERPSLDFVIFLALLQKQQKDTDEWDLARIIHLFPQRRTSPQADPTDYYRILKELAKLNRSDMRLFKERFKQSMKDAEIGKEVRPYRFDATTGCGFIFIPLCRSDESNKVEILSAFTALNKYDRRLSKCIGLSFLFDGGIPPCDVHWCRLEHAWQEDAEAAALLAKISPFRPIKETIIERYGIK